MVHGQGVSWISGPCAELPHLHVWRQLRLISPEISGHKQNKIGIRICSAVTDHMYRELSHNRMIEWFIEKS